MLILEGPEICHLEGQSLQGSEMFGTPPPKKNGLGSEMNLTNQLIYR